MIYKKLFSTTLEHIKAYSQPLLMTLAAIQDQTDDSEASGNFVGSFVWFAVNTMIEKLKSEQPGACERSNIWS